VTPEETERMQAALAGLAGKLDRLIQLEEGQFALLRQIRDEARAAARASLIT
jgi:hypothetical protein